jgi:hypothetical protein
MPDNEDLANSPAMRRTMKAFGVTPASDPALERRTLDFLTELVFYLDKEDRPDIVEEAAKLEIAWSKRAEEAE